VDATSRIAALAGPAAQSAGLVVDGVEVAAAGSRTRVLITVDLPEDEIGSASLDAIADASRAIGAALDEANVPEGAYVLEVGTPGVDRVLTERRHFLRARTRLVTVQLKGGGSATGRLVDVDGDDLVLEASGETQRVGLADVASGRVEIEFRRLDAVDEDAADEADDEQDEEV
jgi:ribosome maturation factor RimP